MYSFLLHQYLSSTSSSTHMWYEDDDTIYICMFVGCSNCFKHLISLFIHFYVCILLNNLLYVRTYNLQYLLSFCKCLLSLCVCERMSVFYPFIYLKIFHSFVLLLPVTKANNHMWKAYECVDDVRLISNHTHTLIHGLNPVHHARFIWSSANKYINKHSLTNDFSIYFYV